MNTNIYTHIFACTFVRQHIERSKHGKHPNGKAATKIYICTRIYINIYIYICIYTHTYIRTTAHTTQQPRKAERYILKGSAKEPYNYWLFCGRRPDEFTQGHIATRQKKKRSQTDMVWLRLVGSLKS